MKDSRRKFLAILKVELEDLREDLTLLMEEEQAERKSGNHTEYVFRENLSLLKNEFLGVDGIFRELDRIEIDQFPTSVDLYENLRVMLRRRLRELDAADAAWVLIERKLRKVRDYVEGNTV